MMMPCRVAALLLVAQCSLASVGAEFKSDLEDCGVNEVDACTMITDHVLCNTSFIATKVWTKQHRTLHTTRATQLPVAHSCSWQSGACSDSVECKVAGPVTATATDEKSPSPPTAAPHTASPHTASPPGPQPDDGGGMSDGVKYVIFFLTYFGGIGAGIGGIKAYRHYFPPASVCILLQTDTNGHTHTEDRRSHQLRAWQEPPLSACRTYVIRR